MGDTSRTVGNGDVFPLTLDALIAKNKALGTALAIDEEFLDRERVAQPQKYLHASRLYAQYLAQQAKAEIDLRVFEAKMTLKFRREGIPGDVKVTDETVKAAIQAEPEYVALQTKRITALEMATVMFGFQEAMRQRERSIRALEFKQYGGVPPGEGETAAQHQSRILQGARR